MACCFSRIRMLKQPSSHRALDEIDASVKLHIGVRLAESNA